MADAYQIAKPAAGIGLAAGSPVLTSSLAAAGIASSAAGAITAGVGAIVAIGLQLLAAHEMRKKQAQNENQAVNAAVAGWDNAVGQLVAAYNSGQATAVDMQKYFLSPQTGGAGQLWQWYWQEVGPVVQPGRNGCQSGTVAHPPGSFCQGSYGAGCCVAYDDLDNSMLYIMRALAATEADGEPHTANVLLVVGSKYGGQNRPAYTVTLHKPSFSTQATGTLSTGIASVTQTLDAITGQLIGATPTSQGGSNTFLTAIIVGVIVALVVKQVA